MIEVSLDGSAPQASRAVPFWLRIAEVLRSELRNGAYAPGQTLPGEHELAARFGAARMTLRRAMDCLEAEGLLRREVGRGSFPTGPVAGNTLGLTANMSGFSTSSVVTILGSSLCVPTPAVTAALRLTAGVEAFRLERVRRDDRGAFSHVLSWIPTSLAKRLPQKQLERGVPLADILAVRGAVMRRADQVIGAEAATPVVAAALGVAIGSALVRLERTLFDVSGQAFEQSCFLYRPDRFAYSVGLDAEGEAPPPHWVPVGTARDQEQQHER